MQTTTPQLRPKVLYIKSQLLKVAKYRKFKDSSFINFCLKIYLIDDILNDLYVFMVLHGYYYKNTNGQFVIYKNENPIYFFPSN